MGENGGHRSWLQDLDFSLQLSGHVPAGRSGLPPSSTEFSPFLSTLVRPWNLGPGLTAPSLWPVNFFGPSTCKGFPISKNSAVVSESPSEGVKKNLKNACQVIVLI